MMFHDSLDLLAYFILPQSSMCYTEADWHNLDCDDTDPILAAPSIVEERIQLGKEVYIRVETNSDAMNEDDRFPGLRCVRTIPIRKSPGRRATGCEQSQRS